MGPWIVVPRSGAGGGADTVGADVVGCFCDPRVVGEEVG